MSQEDVAKAEAEAEAFDTLAPNPVQQGFGSLSREP